MTKKLQLLALGALLFTLDGSGARAACGPPMCNYDPPGHGDPFPYPPRPQPPRPAPQPGRPQPTPPCLLNLPTAFPCVPGQCPC